MYAVSKVPKAITMVTAAHLLNCCRILFITIPLAQDAFVTTWLHVKNSVAFEIEMLTAVDTSLYHFEVLAAQERFCSMALVGCTGLNVKLGSMTALLIQRTETAILL